MGNATCSWVPGWYEWYEWMEMQWYDIRLGGHCGHCFAAAPPAAVTFRMECWITISDVDSLFNPSCIHSLLIQTQDTIDIPHVSRSR